jgi:hypothetical protein
MSIIAPKQPKTRRGYPRRLTTVARQCATVHSGRERSQAVGEGGLEPRLSLALSRIVARDSPSGAEGEGFEPSSDPRARNGFRDHLETARLQGVHVPLASWFASVRVSLHGSAWYSAGVRRGFVISAPPPPPASSGQRIAPMWRRRPRAPSLHTERTDEQCVGRRWRRPAARA